MKNNKDYDVIIIGGSYAGLSAGMALGRSLRKVLIVDSGKPCNRQTPHSHNFITHDGEQPADISAKAKEQVLKYQTVEFITGLVENCNNANNGFEVTIDAGVFFSKKVLFATGVKDVMPPIPGFASCWGISVLHCPYCHGYEVANATIGILANGDLGYEFCKLISNWSKKLTLFTNGKSTLTEVQVANLKEHAIAVEEAEIASFEEDNGMIRNIHFKNGLKASVTAVFAKIGFEQHHEMAATLGCEYTEQGYIKVDDFGKTNVTGVFAAGDNTSMFRAVSVAIAAGGKAGAAINHELILDEF